MKNRGLGEMLKTCREMSGLTQKELAKQLGVERSYISKVETGEWIPNGEVIKKWGEVTECSDIVAMYFGGADSWKALMQYKLAFMQVKSGLEMLEMTV